MKENASQRAVQESETQQFAQENNLMYIGESSALSDTNIKEVVEALLESNISRFNLKIEIHKV